MRRSQMRLTSDADSYDCHGPATNTPVILADEVSYMLQFSDGESTATNTPVILADEVSYMLQFSDGESEDVQFEFKHLDPEDAIFARRLLLSETKFAGLPGFSSGRIEVRARLTREVSGRRAFHTHLPPRLKDWTAEELRSFFEAYPAGCGQAVRNAGGICYGRGLDGRRLELKRDLVAFLQKEVDGMEAEDAQMLIEDLGCFSNPEYDVKIEFRTSTPDACADVGEAVAAGIPRLYAPRQSQIPPSVQPVAAAPAAPYSTEHSSQSAHRSHGASCHIASTPGAPGAPPLTPPKEFHFFICHHQGSGGDQAHLLFDALRSRGYKVWYDNGVQSDARNLHGMQRGVRSSACLLLLLSGRKEKAGVPDSSGVYEGPFTRWYCHHEMATARSERLPVIGVMEVEERYNKADLVEEKRRARTGGANGGPISEHAEDILALLDGPNSVVFLPFRRQQHETEAMLAEICSQYVSKVVNSAQTGNSPWDRNEGCRVS
jgi:hypothetical protein